jgi:hypothetical protein
VTMTTDRTPHGMARLPGEVKAECRMARAVRGALDRVRADLVGTPFDVLVADDLTQVIDGTAACVEPGVEPVHVCGPGGCYRGDLRASQRSFLGTETTT